MAYTLTGETCGTVRLDAAKTGVIVTESVQRSSKVTSNPVEQGADINDHVVSDPVKFTLTGVLIGGDEQAAILRRMCKEKDVLTYTGRSRIENCVITSYKEDVSAKNRDGYAISLTLQVVERCSADYVASGEQLMSMQDSTAPKSVGTAQAKTTSADGLKTTVSQSISSSAYAEYVNSYSNKAAGSAGPSARGTSAFGGAA